jgi:hypothetical protein
MRFSRGLSFEESSHAVGPGSAELGEDRERFLPAGPGLVRTLSMLEGEAEEVKPVSLPPSVPGVRMHL